MAEKFEFRGLDGCWRSRRTSATTPWELWESVGLMSPARNAARSSVRRRVKRLTGEDSMEEWARSGWTAPAAMKAKWLGHESYRRRFPIDGGKRAAMEQKS